MNFHLDYITIMFVQWKENSLSILPDQSDQAEVTLQLVRQYKWTELAVLYERDLGEGPSACKISFLPPPPTTIPFPLFPLNLPLSFSSCLQKKVLIFNFFQS